MRMSDAYRRYDVRPDFDAVVAEPGPEDTFEVLPSLESWCVSYPRIGIEARGVLVLPLTGDPDDLWWRQCEDVLLYADAEPAAWNGVRLAASRPETALRLHDVSRDVDLGLLRADVGVVTDDVNHLVNNDGGAMCHTDAVKDRNASLRDIAAALRAGDATLPKPSPYLFHEFLGTRPRRWPPSDTAELVERG